MPTSRGAVAEWQAWAIHLTDRAAHDLEGLDATTATRALDATERYATTGHGSVKQLTGIRPPLFSLRVRVYRVLFERDLATHALVVTRVLHRRQAYR